MANGRIDVYFHSSGSENGNGNNQEEVGQSQDGAFTTSMKSNHSIARSMIATTGIQYAKKAINYGISVYGDLTGDYITQTKMENAINIGTTAVMMAQFPFGTIAGAFSIATRTASYVIQNNKQNRQTDYFAKRTGNETLNNSEVLR